MGWTNSDNKFGPTGFVVGPLLGDGVNYTSIATAIVDAGSGPADIYIRPGTYVEDLNFPGNVNLIGTSLSGDTSLAQIIIEGNHQVAVQSLTLCYGIRFTSSNLMDNFTVQDALGGIAAIEFVDCSFLANTRNFFVGSGAGSGQIKLVNCTLEANGRNIEVPTGAIHGDYELRGCFLTSTGDANIYMDSDSTGTCTGSELTAAGSSNFYFDTNSTAATLDVLFTKMQSPAVANITFQTTATVNSYHNVFNPLGSSEFITGPGIYNYGDNVIIGSIIDSGIDNAATQTVSGWRPWATTGTFPSSSTSTPRGTVAFDGAFFDCIDGQMAYGGSVAHAPIYELDADSGSAMGLGPFGIQVNIRGKAGCTTEASTNNLDIYAIKYTSIIASGAAVPDFGHWITTTVTTTLPAAPEDSTVFSFIITGAATVETIQAPGTSRIRIGSLISSAGGTATSTAQGDSLRLVYRLADDIYYAEHIIGTWTLA